MEHQQQQLGQRSGGGATPSRAFQFHTARPTITELFNLYLGLRSYRPRLDKPSPRNPGIASPTQSSMELSSGMAVSPIKSPDISSSMMQASMRGSPLTRDSTVSSLHQLCCKIIVMGLAFNLKPVIHAYIFSHV
ncbi:hypothetical protein MLD38_017549 [Melastoma candidum]|uniref:Uncharacterized protein n=1 Tax=Melastoma candidum TaxID=119954 RepID=A0ACB9QQW9_9MYRT|nr:hypothetical protein MLD38_017549 [Melastoma candidum]